MGVQTGTHGGRAKRHRVQAVECRPHAGQRIVDLRDPSADHLSERDRHGVLEVRAANHHDVGIGRGLLGQGVAQRRDRGRQPQHDALGGGDVHHDREPVVRGLPFVDVIVGMHRFVRSERLARELIGAVGDHLVRVHVALRAGSRLKHDERKLRIERAGDHLIRRPRDQVRAILGDRAELAVGQCR